MTSWLYGNKIIQTLHYNGLHILRDLLHEVFVVGLWEITACGKNMFTTIIIQLTLIH